MKPKPLDRTIRQITGLLLCLSVLLGSLAYPVHAQGGGSDGHGN